jgi:hypothetical protein
VPNVLPEISATDPVVVDAILILEPAPSIESIESARLATQSLTSFHISLIGNNLPQIFTGAVGIVLSITPLVEVILIRMYSTTSFGS